MAPSAGLLQGEGEDEAELLLHNCLDAAQVAQIEGYLRTHLALQQRLWQACTASLRSDWTQHRWDDSTPDSERTLERSCVDFLEQQRRWREQDILALQRLPLTERVERYRSPRASGVSGGYAGCRGPLSVSVPAAAGGAASTLSCR